MPSRRGGVIIRNFPDARKRPLLGTPHASSQDRSAGHPGRRSPHLLRHIARRLLVNESIETGHFQPFTPAEFPKGHPYTFKLSYVAIRDLTDEQLLDLSRKGHLFLDLREMQAIQTYFREQQRDPT